jgi:hypothetical protein
VIVADFTRHCIKSPLPVAVQFAAQGGKRWFADSAIGETNFFSGQLFKKLVAQIRINLCVNDRT